MSSAFSLRSCFVSLRLSALVTYGLLLLLALLGPGCRGVGEQIQEIDLAAQLPLAEISHESSEFHPEDPEVKGAFREGWSGKGKSWWSVGEHSVLVFFLADPRSISLTFRCQPFNFSDAPPQVMSITLNGRRIDDVTLVRAVQTYRVELPEELLLSGQNRLVFSYAYSRSPAEVLEGSTDRRKLAVLWQNVRLPELGATGTVQARRIEDEPVLALPFGAEVRYFAKLEEDVVFSIDRLISQGSVLDEAQRPPTLELGIRVTDERHGIVAERHRLEAHRAVGPQRISISAQTGKLVEISLRAVPVSPRPEHGSGLRVVGPRLLIESREAPSSTPVVSPLQGSTAPPNIIVYLIDTLRADHLGVYGYPRPVSPNLDRFAADGTTFLASAATTSWTRPSVASLFTGLYPQVHGVNATQDGLGEGPRVIGELLQEVGYTTVGFTTNGNVHPKFGFGRGFDLYEHAAAEAGGEGYRSSRLINETVEQWLDQHSASPFFLFLHTVDPHAPYQAESPWREQLAGEVEDPSVGAVQVLQDLNVGRRVASAELRRDLIDLYDAEIAANDHYFGELLEMLKTRGLYEDCLIIVLSDHGEEFGDHGRWSHGLTLFEEQLMVPLVVKWPRGWKAGSRVEERVGLVDLVPTLLDLLDLPAPEGLQGSSLLRHLVDRAKGRGVAAENATYAYLDKDGRKIQSVVEDSFKRIDTLAYDRPVPPILLVDLEDDPGERVNLVENQPIRTGYLGSLLKAAELRWTARTAAEEVELDSDLRGELEALGYLQ